MEKKRESLKRRGSEKNGGRSLPLDVVKVMEDFQKSEDSSPRRNGTFKIDAPFEKALDSILKAKTLTKHAPKKPR